MTDRIVIQLANGYKLVAEQNTDPNYSREVYIGILDNNDSWYQDLAIVRNAHEIDDGLNTVWYDDKFDIIVYSDSNCEDYTHSFTVELYQEE